MTTPHNTVSTYRLQFGPALGFRDAFALVPYLDALGISDCYASPLLASTSDHGYDISDHSTLNPALGSEEDFREFTAALRSRGMGLLLDFVPNHMGLDLQANQWWRDVLEHGRSSIYADYFDIDWEPVAPSLWHRILLPILQDAYGDVLHRGQLRLEYCDGALRLAYEHVTLPIEPRSAGALLKGASKHEHPRDSGAWTEYGEILTTLSSLPAADTDDASEREVRRGAASAARTRLATLVEANPDIRAEIDDALLATDGVPGQPDSYDRLHDLLEQQPYRLAHWRTALDEINYRRFFDVNHLGALRMENECVFEAAHRKILELIARGDVTGLRIDHPDGLLEPRAYFQRLLAAIATARGAATGAEPFLIVAEKILGDGEALPADWPIAGTTGYGFLNDVGRLFVDTARESAMRTAYQRLTGRRESFDEIAYQSKRLVMDSSMASELSVLAHQLKRIADQDRATRDFTLTALVRTLSRVTACFPVYRTYVSHDGFNAVDREHIDLAIDQARRRSHGLAPALFMFVRQVLLAENPADPLLTAKRVFTMKFQQFTAPVEAKGIEDTAFYRYPALLSLNEVGGDPRRFGASVDYFHAGNRVRRERWPRELIATATHDTKRGEDARSRLHVLSEIPRAWAQAVSRWRKLNAVHRTAVDRESALDANDEYLLYQTLVGAWPADALDQAGWDAAAPLFAERVTAYMRKAIRESKLRTSWLNQNVAYEDAVIKFVGSILTGASAQSFVSSCLPFIRRVAALGMVNSLAQLVLKIASPGVPDFYQGTEFWQLELADPDNRGPVDFARRQAMLDSLMPCVMAAAEARRRSRGPGASRTPVEDHVGELLRQWTDARIKMFITACGLRLRSEDPSLFLLGDYTPLGAVGQKAPHLVAFARSFENRHMVVVVPRLVGGLTPTPEDGICRPELWNDTQVLLPPSIVGEGLVHAFTGTHVRPPEDGRVHMSDLCRTCPVALLVSRAS